MDYTLALLLFGLLSSFILGVVADNANFTIQPQDEHVITLNLREGDRVSGSFSSVGSDEFGINFYVRDPYGRIIQGYDNTAHASFSFVADQTGSFQLHFNNSFSQASAKTIALNYNITHYIFGLPQEQFVFIMIAIFSVVGLVTFALLKPRY